MFTVQGPRLLVPVGPAEQTVLFDADRLVISHTSVSPSSFIGANGDTVNAGSGSNGTSNMCFILGVTSISGAGGSTPSLSPVWDPATTAQAFTPIPGASFPGVGTNTPDIIFFYLMNPTLGQKNLTFSWLGGATLDLAIVQATFVNVDQTGGATTFPSPQLNSGTSTTTAFVNMTASPTTRKLMAMFGTTRNFNVGGASGNDLGHDNSGSIFAAGANWDAGSATSLSYTYDLANAFGAAGIQIKGH